MLGRVVKLVLTDVSEVRNVSIISVSYNPKYFRATLLANLQAPAA
jgi:hypothetical protein